VENLNHSLIVFIYFLGNTKPSLAPDYSALGISKSGGIAKFVNFTKKLNDYLSIYLAS
jgi:hypothetical protein